MILGFTQLLTETSIRIYFCGVWEPRRLTILWASIASYRDRFTFTLYSPIRLNFYWFCEVWEPRRLTTLWASIASYRDRFTFTLYSAN
jgi:hypothetical protein